MMLILTAPGGWSSSMRSMLMAKGSASSCSFAVMTARGLLSFTVWAVSEFGSFLMEQSRTCRMARFFGGEMKILVRSIAVLTILAFLIAVAAAQAPDFSKVEIK